MNEEINNPTSAPETKPFLQEPANNIQNTGVVPPSRPGGEKIIQPSATIKQVLQVQQQQQAAQTAAVAPQSPQPAPTTQQPTYHPPAPAVDGQMQVGMSASQLGLNNPHKKLFDFNVKKLIMTSLVGLLLLGGAFAGLVYANIITLSELKTISYDNAKGDNYKIKFYSKHTSKETKSGVKQLVSKVSTDGKFPITFLISSGNLSSYNKLKDCASFTKAFDVQNNNLNQKISVCNALNGSVSGQNVKDAVYIAGFKHNDQLHLVTVGQDYSGIDLSSQSEAKESLTKFGLDVYKEDIETIVSSIKVE